jgi:hypothetical protein
MTRTMLWALTASTAVAGTTYLYGQGTPVELQPTTPGTKQVGNANISGRIIAGSILAENSTPTAQVIVGNATSTSGANFGGFFRSDSPLGRALYGRASALSGTTHGVWGQADSPGGRGVTGVAPATTGNATGVWGQTASTTGRGVYGYTTSASGVNYGVMGQSSSPNGFGVYSVGNMHATGVISGDGSGVTNVNAASLGGFPAGNYLRSIPVPLYLNGNQAGPTFHADNYQPSSVGVRGTSHGNFGSGVLGVRPSGVAAGAGVRGEAHNDAGIAVEGFASIGFGGSNFGGYFTSSGSNGQGVHGVNVSSSGTTYGVVGEVFSSLGFGLYSLGKTGASGTKSFRIDHPFDPENKYLLHYSAEGPDVLNVYTGNIRTDARGYATVKLPAYFSEINKDPRYTLTVVDASEDFVLAKVSQEIADNQFVVRTNKPLVKVSWRVEAIRNDRWTRAYGAPVEEEKIGAERGTYQHPDLYGMPAESRVSYRPDRVKAPDPQSGATPKRSR